MSRQPKPRKPMSRKPMSRKPMSRKKAIAVCFLSFLVLLLILVGRMLGPDIRNSLHGANGYATKWVCSSIFVSGLSQEAAVADLPPNPLLDWLRVRVDEEAGSVTTSAAGLFGRTAIFRPGFGCTLIPPGGSASELVPLPSPAEEMAAADGDLPWPAGDREIRPEDLPAELDRERLEAAIDRAFEETEPTQPKKTRAVAVVYEGRLVAERYAEGFDRHTVLTGWSMTKSLTNALVGRLVIEKGLDIRTPALPEWYGRDDPRRQLTYDHLLRMSTGLAFDETYTNLLADAVRMLFVLPDSGGYAASKPLIHTVDTVWSYSSGTTNMLSKSLRRPLGSDADYHRYPREALFEPLGAKSALIEPDASGTFVGSSFGWATARDWARFGLLYLQDGVWNGERLLPEGWVAYSVTPTPAAPEGLYGAQIWLNAGSSGDPADRPWPELPEDLYYFSGYNGQSVTVVPSRRCVIVRLGLSHRPSVWDSGTFLIDMLGALPEEPAPDVDSDSGDT